MDIMYYAPRTLSEISIFFAICSVFVIVFCFTSLSGRTHAPWCYMHTVLPSHIRHIQGPGLTDKNAEAEKKPKNNNVGSSL